MTPYSNRMTLADNAKRREPLRGHHVPVPGWYGTARQIAEAVGVALVFVVFCAILLTVPTWGPWLESLGEAKVDTAAVECPR